MNGVNHMYPVRVTLSQRTCCANLHRRVYDKMVARILGSNPGVFGSRTLARVYTCAGTWQLTVADRAGAATRAALLDPWHAARAEDDHRTEERDRRGRAQSRARVVSAAQGSRQHLRLG